MELIVVPTKKKSDYFFDIKKNIQNDNFGYDLIF